MSNVIRRVIINTKKAPAAIGPYNQAVMVNQTVGEMCKYRGKLKSGPQVARIFQTSSDNSRVNSPNP